MQYVLRHNVRPGQNSEFKEWLLANESNFSKHSAPGWSYLGSYFTVLGFGRYQAESRWQVDDYAALGNGFGDEDGQRLLREWFGFMDNPNDVEVYLLKDATDVAILE